MLTEADVQRVWDENAPRWISQVRRGLDTLREHLNNPAFFDHFLDDLKDKDVIDIGCGEGYNTRLLAQRGSRMTGIDLSAKLIEAARQLEKEKPLNIRYRICSLTALAGVQSASFDAAVSTMVFMDSPDFDLAAREVFRVLRSGGMFYFSIAHPCFWTSGSRWISDKAGRSEGLLTTDYWNDQVFWETLQFVNSPEGELDEAISIPHFPFRLENYINALANAGFRICRMLEPRPVPRAIAQHPTQLGRIDRHAPVSLFIAATK